MFLLDYAAFAQEDLDKNAEVFGWPEKINHDLKVNQERFEELRESSEDKLRKKRIHFEKKLENIYKEVEMFRKKDVSWLCAFNAMFFVNKITGFCW